MSTAAIREIMDLNVVGLMIANREAVRRMSTKRGGSGGAIVNLSSIAPRIGGSNGSVHYAASTGAVDARTTGLGREVAGEGLRATAGHPGLDSTDNPASARLPHTTRP